MSKKNGKTTRRSERIERLLNPVHNIDEKAQIHNLYYLPLSEKELKELHMAVLRPSALDAIEHTAWMQDGVYYVQRIRKTKENEMQEFLRIAFDDDTFAEICSADSTYTCEDKTILNKILERADQSRTTFSRLIDDCPDISW